MRVRRLVRRFADDMANLSPPRLRFCQRTKGNTKLSKTDLNGREAVRHFDDRAKLAKSNVGSSIAPIC